ncbi:MAG: hypothetical protein R3F43_17965 [bacterium]
MSPCTAPSAPARSPSRWARCSRRSRPAWWRVDNTPLFIQAVSWQQAIQYFTVSEHIYQPALLVVNKAWYDGLPPDLQTAVLAPKEALEAKGRMAVRSLGPLLLKNFEAQNVKVYKQTPTRRRPCRRPPGPPGPPAASRPPRPASSSSTPS